MVRANLHLRQQAHAEKLQGKGQQHQRSNHPERTFEQVRIEPPKQAVPEQQDEHQEGGHGEEGGELAEHLDRPRAVVQKKLNGDQVENHADRAGDSILGLAELPRVVTYLHLVERPAHPARKRGDEPVHLAVEPDVLDHVAVVHLQRTSMIVQVHPGDPADEPVGHHGRKPPVDERVLAILPPAAHHVDSLLGARNQLRNVRRIVLQIRV